MKKFGQVVLLHRKEQKIENNKTLKRFPTWIELFRLKNQIAMCSRIPRYKRFRTLNVTVSFPFYIIFITKNKNKTNKCWGDFGSHEVGREEWEMGHFECVVLFFVVCIYLWKKVSKGSYRIMIKPRSLSD